MKMCYVCQQFCKRKWAVSYSFQEFQRLFYVNSNFLEYEGKMRSFRKALTDFHVGLKQNAIKVKIQILNKGHERMSRNIRCAGQ
jgi:hypothetical protein